MNNYIIILGGGCGKRLEDLTPKQFLYLDNLPILMHTINAFVNSKLKPKILLVLHPTKFNYWKDLCEKHNFCHYLTIVAGGDERFHSVKNALEYIKDDNAYVGVHDGVRPFVTEEVITKTFSAAHKLGNAVPAVPATNTIRFFDGNTPSRSLDRRHVYVVQNPQVFRINDLRDAYKQDYNILFTDDAIAVENTGKTINIVEGDQRNIKITHPVDLSIAHGILNYNKFIYSNIKNKNTD